MKMGKKGKHAISSSFSQVFSFSWISKIKRMAGKSSAALPSAEPVNRNCSKAPAAPTNESESSPCRLQPGRFSESGRPMCSVTNFAYSPEVLDKRTGLRVAGAIEAEEDFWRFSFRRQSFEWERYAHPPGEDRGRRAFSVDFESSLHFRQSGKLEAEEAKEQPKNQNFPPLNLKRPDHQKFKDSKPRRKCTPQRSPVRGDLFSPRTICKIRAVEEMKRRRRKKEGKRRPGLEGFAVVKKSWDPQRDFRESMVEMISEKKMGGGEELEKLLACYLELNAAEFHDLIIKVFRQVWFDLNRDSGLGASELEQGYFDY